MSAHVAVFVAAIGFWAKHTRSRAPARAALLVITWRLRLVTVMAGSGALLLKQSFELVWPVLVSFECSCGV
jgi:hypothetical protein